MITPREISRAAFREGMSDRAIEKDYVITWLLLAIADSPLRGLLAFKGGTALKKIYFPDYRYSEDLDFTLVEPVDAEALLKDLRRTLDLLAGSRGFESAIPAERVEQRADSVTVYVNFAGPLRARLQSRDVKIDFTLSEKLLFPLVDGAIRSSYSDAVEGPVVTYSLEEILVEKLCAILGRTEPRDIYDAHFLLRLPDLEFHEIPQAFKEKALSKGVDASGLRDVLSRKQATFAKMWDNRLRHQIQDLPHVEGVLRELNRKFREHGVVPDDKGAR